MKPYEQRVAEFKATHPDFAEKVNRDDIPVHNDLLQIIRGCENGPQISYFLGCNPEFALQLSRLLPVYAAFEIGRLSAQLEDECPQE